MVSNFQCPSNFMIPFPKPQPRQEDCRRIICFFSRKRSVAGIKELQWQTNKIQALPGSISHKFFGQVFDKVIFPLPTPSQITAQQVTAYCKYRRPSFFKRFCRSPSGSRVHVIFFLRQKEKASKTGVILRLALNLYFQHRKFYCRCYISTNAIQAMDQKISDIMCPHQQRAIKIFVLKFYSC